MLYEMMGELWLILGKQNTGQLSPLFLYQAWATKDNYTLDPSCSGKLWTLNKDNDDEVKHCSVV